MNITRYRRDPSWADGEGLFLGWRGDGGAAPAMGFAPAGGPRRVPPRDREAITYTGNSHLMTVAPTGTGKGTGVIIPNLLTYAGPAIVIDIKGENYQVTARRRREMGQRVVALDPFRVATDGRDCLNPMDVFDLPGGDQGADAEMLADQIAGDRPAAADRYWEDTGKALLSGLIAQIAGDGPAKCDRNLPELRGYLYDDDMDFRLATMLDQKRVAGRLAREEFVAYLSTPADKTRPCIRSTACTFVKALGSKPVADSLRKSSFGLQGVMDGEPMTVYLIVPPEKLHSHRALLRLWVSTLLTAVVRRRHAPARRTLFLLDEAAQLGTLPLLSQAMTLMRGYGLQVWTFWQELGQLRRLYPDDWTTMVANAAVLQAFGVPAHGPRGGWAGLLGRGGARRLGSLDAGEMFVSVNGRGRAVGGRADYLADGRFAGLYDPNPRFRQAAAGPKR